MNARRAALWSIPPVLVVAVLIGWPLAVIVYQSFQANAGFSAGPAWQVTLADSATWRAVETSLIIAVSATLGCVIVGTFIALVLAFVPFPGSKIVEWWLGAVVCFPSFLIPLALGVLFGGVGVVPKLIGALTGSDARWNIMTSMPGVVLGEIIFFTPFVARPVTEALRRIPSNQLDVAASLGASVPRILRQVILPAVAPAISAAAALTFLLTLNEIGIVLFTGAKNVTTLPMLIYSNAIVTFNMATASVLACIQVAISIGLYCLYRVIARDH